MGLDEDLEAHLAAVRGTVADSGPTIDEIAQRLVACFQGPGKLLICGNGGSAADSQHFAAEFVNHLRHERPALPAIALTTDTSVLTSIANDRHYEDVFARQIEALGAKGDVLIAISTSGASRSVLSAMRAARDRGLVTIGLTGALGTQKMAPDSDLLLSVPSTQTERVQEAHLFVLHVIAGMVEAQMFGADSTGQEQEARSS